MTTRPASPAASRCPIPLTQGDAFGFTIDHAADGDGSILRIVVSGFSPQDTGRRLSGAIDNRDGYGSDDAAAAVARMFRAYVDAGIPTVYEVGSGRDSGNVVAMSWRRYPAGGRETPWWGGPSIQACGWERPAASMARALAFLGGVARKIDRHAYPGETVKRYGATPADIDHACADPADVIKALYRLRAVPMLPAESMATPEIVAMLRARASTWATGHYLAGPFPADVRPRYELAAAR